jgi:hypothetical protein
MMPSPVQFNWFEKMLGFKENEGIASFSPANNLTCLGPGKTKHKSFNFSFSTANE